MNEDSRESEVGEIKTGEKELDMEIITWKIPNASRIVHALDYGVQSPSFSFAGSIWILKVYFYGQTSLKSEGYIDVVIERLNYEIQEQEVYCKIYCKNIFHKEFKRIMEHFTFNSKQNTGHVTKFMENFQDKLDKFEIVPNDTFTLVCEITDFAIETKSVEQAARETLTISEKTGMPEVGKIYKTPYQVKVIKWTIQKALTLPSPEDSQVQSPTFSFASASWTLKLYPYFRMKKLNKPYVYVALKRLHSDIPEHCVSTTVWFDDPIDESSLKNYRFDVFDSDHVQGDFISFSIQEPINRQEDTFTFVCMFEIKKNAENQLNSDTTIGFDRKSRHCAVYPVEKLLRDFKELFLSQEDCDVILKVKGQEFSAHRIILKARSSVFSCTFRNNMKEKATGIVDIEDCDPSSFSDFLRFLYCGSVENLSTENVFSLFKAADKYDVQDLKSQCLEFIEKNISVDSFCDTIALAVQHSEKKLIELATDFFAKNFQKIIVTVKWLSFLLENPIQGNEILIKALVNENK